MNALCCLDGTNTEWLARQIFGLLNAHDLRLVLLYVIDSGPGQDMERMRQRYMGIGQRRADLLAQATQAEQEQAAELLAAALEVFRAQWPGGPPDAAQIEATSLRGRPEQEIVRLSASTPSDLIIIGNRRVRGPHEPPHPPGPKSVGHVARFVVDHAPCPVLLLRPA
ncbi:MAG TPA: universal stress protein [Ktedonobacterales bacterium]|nr:universal stress protein [Ktedonobacterales bacterium]